MKKLNLTPLVAGLLLYTGGATSLNAQTMIYPAYASDRQIDLHFYLEAFPVLAPIDGYPIYVAPGVRANYFFFDGLFWVFTEDGHWVTSQGYNGPWSLVDPDALPIELLQLPIQYYPEPPRYFAAWSYSEPPHWHEIYGVEWSERHTGWRHRAAHQHDTEWRSMAPNDRNPQPPAASKEDSSRIQRSQNDATYVVQSHRPQLTIPPPQPTPVAPATEHHSPEESGAGERYFDRKQPFPMERPEKSTNTAPPSPPSPTVRGPVSSTPPPPASKPPPPNSKPNDDKRRRADEHDQ